MTIIFLFNLSSLRLENPFPNDFNSSDIIVNGGTISNFSNRWQYLFNVIVNPNVEKIQVSIDEGAGGI